MKSELSVEEEMMLEGGEGNLAEHSVCPKLWSGPAVPGSVSKKPVWSDSEKTQLSFLYSALVFTGA